MTTFLFSRLRVPAALLALSLCFGGEAMAQAQPTPAAIAAARDYIASKGATAMFEGVVSGTIDRTRGFFLQTNTALGKDLSEIAAQLRTEMAAKREEAIDVFARVVAARFTEQELKDATAFFKSALGQKLVQQEPIALDEGMQRVRTWSEEFAEEVAVRMRAEMKKRGHTI